MNFLNCPLAIKEQCAITIIPRDAIETAVKSGFSEPACCINTSANETQRNKRVPSLAPLQMDTNAIAAELINGKKLPINATIKACKRPRNINSARAFKIVYLILAMAISVWQ